MSDQSTRDVEMLVREAAAQVVVTPTGDPSGSLRRRSLRMRRIRKVRRAGVGVVVGALVGVGVGFGLSGSGSARQIVITGVPPVPGFPRASSSLPPASVEPRPVPTTAGPAVPRPLVLPTSPSAPTTAVPSLETPPPVQAVPGYSRPQALQVIKECLSEQAPAVLEPGAVLRAVASDQWGTTVEITTASGWIECDLLPGGVVDSPPMARTYASTDGWASGDFARVDPRALVAPSDAPDYWLSAPMELLYEGSGVMDYVDRKERGIPTPYLTTVVGRADSAVAVVVVTMPNGAMVKAPVENGMFVARLVTPTIPAYAAPQPQGLIAYDAAGQVIYKSPPADAAGGTSPAASCWVTPGPGGQAVTPPVPGQTCRPAIPWR